MKYEVLNTRGFEQTLLDMVLSNRNIKNPDLLLDVPKKYEEDFSKLNNIFEGGDLLIDTLSNNKNIALVVDCDVDGYSSSAILYNYIKRIYPKSSIAPLFHTGKQHGLSNDITIPDDANLVILPDAGSNDFEQHEELLNKGIKTLVIDHHDADGESDYALVINNQLSDGFINKDLSGSGVVYKFCQMLDKKLGVNYSKDYVDLAMLGIVGDSIDLNSLDARYIVQQGLNNIKNKFLKALIEKQSYSIGKELTIDSVGWNISPLINGVVRAGTQGEKEMMFRAFIETDETVPYKKRGADKEIQQSIYEAMARVCGNVKGRQDRLVKKFMETVSIEIEKRNLNQNKIIVIDVSGDLDRTLTGLVANRLVSIYKRPVLLLQEHKDGLLYGGSARNYRGFGVTNLRDFCIQTNQFVFCEGHQGAFGFSIVKENVSKFEEIVASELENVETYEENIYLVDAVIDAKQIDKSDIVNIGKLKSLWGNGIKEPLFAIKNIKTSSSGIELLGSRATTCKFKFNNIEYIKPFLSKEMYEKMALIKKDSFGDTNISMDIIGKFNLNEWNGNVTPQIEIVDFVSKKDNEVLF